MKRATITLATIIGLFAVGLLTDISLHASSPGSTYNFVPIADTSGPIPFNGFISPTVNDAGTVVFKATLYTGSSGIFSGNGGTVATLYDTSGPFAAFNSRAFVNKAGTVAFSASLDAGGEGVFSGNGGAFTAIADTNGPFSGIGVLSINNL